MIHWKCILFPNVLSCNGINMLWWSLIKFILNISLSFNGFRELKNICYDVLLSRFFSNVQKCPIFGQWNNGLRSIYIPVLKIHELFAILIKIWYFLHFSCIVNSDSYIFWVQSLLYDIGIINTFIIWFFKNSLHGVFGWIKFSKWQVSAEHRANGILLHYWWGFKFIKWKDKYSVTHHFNPRYKLKRIANIVFRQKVYETV